MSRIIMMVGVPASGKSTRAKEILNTSKNTKRVNRDLLREMLDFSKWTPQNEELVVTLEKELAKIILKTGRDVLVDDTNISKKHKDMWQNVAQECNADFEVESMPDLSLQELIERDSKREKSVGEDVIKQMLIQAGKIKNQFVVCDIDGTIADCSHRQHYVSGEKKDWKGFFSEMSKDKFRTEIWEQVYKENKPVIIVTARPDTYREETLTWLKENGVVYFTIYMRGADDKRPDTQVKNTILKRIGTENISKVYDDRPQVIVKTWIPNLGKDKVIDVGNNDSFIDERKELDYWTTI